MTITPEKRLQILKEIGDAVLEMVAATGAHGLPSGTIYASLMPYGCTLAQHETLLSALVGSGRLRRSGFLYFYIPLDYRAKCGHCVWGASGEYLVVTKLAQKHAEASGHVAGMCAASAVPSVNPACRKSS